MLAIWIVIAVVAVLLVTAAVLLPRRRARRVGAGREASARPLVAPTPPPTPKTKRPPGPPKAPSREAAAEVEALGAPEAPEAPEALEETAQVEERPAPALRDRMGKTRGLLSGYVRALRAKGSVDDQTWEQLEEALLRADVGVATTTALLDDLRARVRTGGLRGADAVIAALRSDLLETLRVDGVQPGLADDAGTAETSNEASDGDGDFAGRTEVWLFVGVNGVGKTTTIAKVARRQVADGRSVVLAAGDTFRAAAAEQLTTWADRTGVPVVRGAEGADPSAVVYDAVRSAASRGDDLVLADTAGRLHTKVNLVEELKKIRRVADRPPGHVTEVLLVLDATTGQNGLAQARQFTEAVGVTGVVLTKLDGTAKGGIVVAIQRELGLPVKMVGIGEGVDDLVPFDADEFVDALFE